MNYTEAKAIGVFRSNIAVCQPNGDVLAFVKEEDIERLAVNILTILGSKHLATLNIKNE